MDMYKFLTDTVVDVISEYEIKAEKVEKEDFKRGFFLQKPYINSMTTLKNRKVFHSSILPD